MEIKSAGEQYSKEIGRSFEKCFQQHQKLSLIVANHHVLTQEFVFLLSISIFRL